MSSFCTNCGNQLPDNAAFCPHCGTARRTTPAPAAPQPTPAPAAPQVPADSQPAPVGQQPNPAPAAPQSVVTPAPAAPVTPQQAPAPQTAAPAASTLSQLLANPKKLLIPAIALVAVIAIVIAVMSLSGGGKGGSSYEDAIDNYLSVQIGKISMSKVKALAPQEYWDYMEDRGYDFDEYYEEIADEVDEYIDELEDQFGNNVKYTFEVTRERDISERNLGYIAEYLADTYDIDVDDVTAGYRLDLEFTISGSDDSDTDEAKDVYVLKLDGKWYLAEVSLDKENTRVYFYTA